MTFRFTRNWVQTRCEDGRPPLEKLLNGLTLLLTPHPLSKTAKLKLVRTGGVLVLVGLYRIKLISYFSPLLLR